jgi:predicted small secreted protein
MRRLHPSAARWWLVAACFTLAACSDPVTAPGRDPEIINATDNFQYQISDIRGYSGTQVYT